MLETTQLNWIEHLYQAAVHINRRDYDIANDDFNSNSYHSIDESLDEMNDDEWIPDWESCKI